MTGFTEAGSEATHVADLGLASADDATIFDAVAAAGDVLITADSDFTALLAARRTATPSWYCCARSPNYDPTRTHNC